MITRSIPSAGQAGRRTALKAMVGTAMLPYMQAFGAAVEQRRPTWHVIAPPVDVTARFVIVNLEPPALSFPEISPTSSLLKKTNVIFVITQKHGAGDDAHLPDEVLAAAKERHALIAVFQNDVRSAQTAITDLVAAFGNHTMLNLDIEYLRDIFDQSGHAPFVRVRAGSGLGSGQNGIEVAFQIALRRAGFTSDADLENLPCLVPIISCSRTNLILENTQSLVKALRLRNLAKTNFICPAYDDSLGDRVRVTVVAVT